MIYVVIFLIANAIGVISGYLTATHYLKDSIRNEIKGNLHFVKEDDNSPPYIFLEIEDEKDFNLISNSEYVTIKVVHD